jgi:peptidoglycan/LPS O-acetylase OafA/YrhL
MPFRKTEHFSVLRLSAAKLCDYRSPGRNRAKWPRENQGYMFTLDGWRALAIMAVLVDHTVAYEFHDRHWLFVLTRIGANGVSLFFAISGFLICSRLLEEQSAFGRISLKGFYIRRACRILPAALAYLMFITLLAFLGYIAVDRQ